MPCTPMDMRASRTSSSLKGLMMAVISFMKDPALRRSVRAAGEIDTLRTPAETVLPILLAKVANFKQAVQKYANIPGPISAQLGAALLTYVIHPCGVHAAPPPGRLRPRAFRRA